MAKTGFTDLLEQIGAGQEYIAKDGNDSTLRFKMLGDTFPRVVIAVRAGDLLVGNGASPPVSVIGSPGGPGVSNGLPVYNVVAQYEADNTGASDAASPINQAISDAHAAGGGIVFVPAGTYSIESADVVMLTGVTLLAESVDGVTFLDDRVGGSTVAMRGTLITPIERCHVEGINITGANPGTNTRKGIEFRYAQRCTATRCEVENSVDGAWVYGSVGCSISRSRFVNCSSTNATAKAAVRVVDDASGHSDSIHITECVFEDCYERDVVVAGTGAFRPEAIEIAGCRSFGGAFRGPRVRLATTRSCRVHDNTFSIDAFAAGYSTRNPVIYVSDAAGATIYGNTIMLTGASMVTAAILIEATALTSTGVTVAHNKFYVDASCAPSVALVEWTHTAPHYNLVGTDRDNVAVNNAGNAELRFGVPDTFSETMIHGPLYAKECGVVADGVAFDGVAFAAFIERCNTEGRHGILPAHATILCAADASTATPITIDRYGATGDIIIEGHGGGNTIVDFVADLGLDPEGRPVIGWNPINCEQSGSLCLYNVTFVGNQDQSASALAPNATTVAPEKGAGVRIPNRCDYRGVEAHGFKYGFIQDGTEVQDYAATVLNNNATITVTRPLDRAWTGVSVTGTNIPVGATIITIAVDGLSFTVNNAHKPTGNGSAVRIAIPQNTDHFTTEHVEANSNGIGLYLTRMDGTEAGGTLDFVYRDWKIGQCQWAGVACSDTGALHDALLDKFHVANVAYSFVKEGSFGVDATLNTFWDNVSCVGVKSEGAGNAHFMDFTGVSAFGGVTGVLELHGIEINGQKTHKAVVNNHTYQPWSGTATRLDGTMSVTGTTAGILERLFTATLTHGSPTVTAVSPAPGAGDIGLPISGGCIKAGTTIANVVGTTITLSQAAGNAGAQGTLVPVIIGHGLGVGDHIAVKSSTDVLYVDSAIIDVVSSATAFTAKLGGQLKTVESNGWSTDDTETTIIGAENIKSQDIGLLIRPTGGGLDPSTTVANAVFKTQVLTFSLPATGDKASGTVLELALTDSATPRAIQFGEIACFRLGAVSDLEQLRVDIQLDPTTENIGTSLWWQFYSLQDVDIAVTPTEAGGMPNLVVDGGLGAHANTRIRKGDTICVPRDAKETFTRGQRLVALGGVGVKVATGGVISDAHEGYARGADGALTVIVNADLSVKRPTVLVQKSGPNYRTAFRSEGGGLRCATPSAIPAGKWLAASADDGEVGAWDGSTAGKLVVAKSIEAGDAQANGFIGAEMVAPFVT